MIVTHIDVSSAPVGGWKRTPQGGIAADCRPTRCGVLKYTYPGGKTVRELRHPDEVFRADSLSTLAGAPVTVGHPTHSGNKVLPENYEQLQKGTLGDNVHQDGNFVAATVRVQAASAVKAVESGKLSEMSCGYDCELDFTAGEWKGEQYDAIQRNIQYNHVALLEKGRGRAGSEVGLKLDSTDGEDCPAFHLDVTSYALEEGTSRSTRATMEFNPELHISKVDHKAAVDALHAKVDEVTSALATAAKAHADAKEASTPAALDKLVASRTALVDAARSLAGKDFKADGLSEHEIRVAALKKAGTDVSDKSPEYVTARFDAKVETIQNANTSHSNAATTLAARGGQTDQSASTRSDASTPVEDTVTKARLEFEKKAASAYKQTTSKMEVG